MSGFDIGYPDPDNMSYEEILALEASIGDVSKGLDAATLAVFPILTAKGGGGDCSICQSPIEAGEKTRGIPCNDVYHQDCLDQWLKDNSTCPVCRTDLRSIGHFVLGVEETV